MTVASSVNLVSAIGNGVTTVFPYTFLMPEGTHVVTLTTIATGIEGSPLVEGTDYTITGEDNPAGGSVTYPISGTALASTHKINIRREVAIAQPYDMTAQSGYDPETLEGVLDDFAMVLSQHAEELSRAYKTGTGTSVDADTLVASVEAAAASAAASAALVLGALVGQWDAININGANIAAAATVNLTTATGNFVDVTGNTGISAITLTEGFLRFVRFTGTPIITVGASLIGNNNASDIQIEAGDMAIFRGYAAGVVRFWHFPIRPRVPLVPKGTNVASAGTISLGEGEYFHITGTTTITDIDFATPIDGRSAVLIFDGALTLTHNSTTLKLPGGANITTAADDRCVIVQDSSDNIIVTSYTRANGSPVVLVDPVLTGTITEDIFTITDAAAFEIDPSNGSMQFITLTANRTPAATNFQNGESMTLHVADGTAYAITWTTVAPVWVGGSAPALPTTGYAVIELWKAGGVMRAAHVGDVGS
jgi:hypothetical protein